MARVTLLTDFGTQDGYVAAMKGVLATVLPDVQIDDVSHVVRQGDIEAASWAVHRYWRLFPPGTVHLIVVDPGVGSERRPLAVQAGDQLFVAPDNGVLTLVLDGTEEWEAREIRTIRPPGQESSRTFHGRDLFAPAAAHLAAGEPLEALGPRVVDPVRFTVPEPHRWAAETRGPDRKVLGVERERFGVGAVGRIVTIDRFGNLVSNLPGDWLEEGDRVQIGDRTVQWGLTYSDVDPGELIALVNSDGLVEVALRDGSAAEALGVGTGAAVRLRR